MRFQLVVSKQSSWITSVEKLDAAAVRLSKARRMAQLGQSVERIRADSNFTNYAG
jgi:hypothetical protein